MVALQIETAAIPLEDAASECAGHLVAQMQRRCPAGFERAILTFVSEAFEGVQRAKAVMIEQGWSPEDCDRWETIVVERVSGRARFWASSAAAIDAKAIRG